MQGKTVNILLVEDDEVDVEAVRRALAKNKVANPLAIASDGIEGLKALRGDGGRAALPRPHLVLLDLNMPRMNGVEFLEELRKDERLKNTVVFVLTTSGAEQDKVEAYGYNVAGYILKASLGDDFMKLLDLLEAYWRIVEFPPESVPA